MYIIVGLGNPGTKYSATRHNVGFEVIERLAYEHNIKLDKNKHRAIIGQGMISGNKVLLAQPQTYMNLSGESVHEILSFYKEDHTSLIVVYDDISLDVGDIRIRKKGSAGGHNGIKNIISHIGTNEFMRVKVGVGSKPPGWNLADYVLSRFPEDEIKNVIEGIKKASDSIDKILSDGVDKAMNIYNIKQKHGES